MSEKNRLHERLARLTDRDRRTVLGIAGTPGAGKTTLALQLVEFATQQLGIHAAWVPMDGFHLADAELERQGTLNRKGAIETFDGWGYAALLHRIRAEREHIVYAPSFERDLEQPIAGAIPVAPDATLIVSEGNYLLVDAPAWKSARDALDEVWYCDAPAATRTERLIARHIAFGKSPVAARAWVASVDEANAAQIQDTRAAADYIIDFDWSTTP